MKKITIFISFILGVLLFQNCTSKSSDSVSVPITPPLEGWELAKSNQSPKNELESEYLTPSRYSLSTLAWEDGIYITRDGLTLYSQYIQIDLYKSTVLDSKGNPDLYLYKRGPSIGQDLTPPLGSGLTSEWIHSDLAYSQRASKNDAFGAWSLSDVNKGLFNDAAPQGILNSSNSAVFDFFVYTDDDNSPSYAPKIRVLKNVARNPSGPGSPLLSVGLSPNSYFDENPHIERYDSSDPNKLVLFFDSKNRNASLDLFYTTSLDGGTTWSAVQAVTSVNSSGTDHQPHLYFDGTSWWLYLSAYNPIEEKMAIYRYRQATAGDWNSWQSKQLVVSAGTAVGVGEPSLTSNGDLTFVVITENTVNPTAFDKYDADPWYMNKK